MSQPAPRQVDVEKVGELLAARIGDLTHQVAVQSVMLEGMAQENAALRARIDELTPPAPEPDAEQAGDDSGE